MQPFGALQDDIKNDPDVKFVSHRPAVDIAVINSSPKLTDEQKEKLREPSISGFIDDLRFMLENDKSIKGHFQKFITEIEKDPKIKEIFTEAEQKQKELDKTNPKEKKDEIKKELPKGADEGEREVVQSTPKSPTSLPITDKSRYLG
jgi:hypothetical protein